MQYQTVSETDASVPGKQFPVLAPMTTVKVSFPNARSPAASYGFAVGDENKLAPTQAIPMHRDEQPAFVNTGRHFLRGFRFLYDADGGQVGLKQSSETGSTGTACGG